MRPSPPVPFRSRTHLLALVLALMPLACDLDDPDSEWESEQGLRGFEGELDDNIAPAGGGPMLMELCLISADVVVCWESIEAEPVEFDPELLEADFEMPEGCVSVPKQLEGDQDMQICPNFLIPPGAGESKPQRPIIDEYSSGSSSSADPEQTPPTGG